MLETFGSGCPVFDVEAIEFDRGFVGRADEGLGVGEGAAFGGSEEEREIDTAAGFERAFEFVAFAVDAGDADGENFSDAESDEVIKDRAGGAGLAANVGDVVDGEIRFDGNFLARGVDVEIAVEAKIADDGDAEVRITRGDFIEALRGHRHWR